MTRTATPGIARRLTRRVASVSAIPASVRAVLGYYAETGRFDYRALKLKGHVDETVDAIIADVFEDVERALAEEFGVEDASFSYGTKLTMPAELTLGYLYRRALATSPDGFDPVTGRRSTGLGSALGAFSDSVENRPHASSFDGPEREAVEYVERAEAVTELVVKALIDGDMRDALNDEEYEDFQVDIDIASTDDRARVATIAQRRLQSMTEQRFEGFSAAVREPYEHAVEVSEAHQDRDDAFRDLFTRARDGDADAVDEIEQTYKFAPFEEVDNPFAGAEGELPYLKTQYGRVGVIYDGMIDMYRGAGFDVDEAFEKAIVLAIIGAQIWLDDIGDYPQDLAEGQLTPVTAEYVLKDSDADAYDAIVDISHQYFDRAKEYALTADSALTGIAVEYIIETGDLSVLPGHRRGE